MKLFTRKPPPIECRQVVETVTAYLDVAMTRRDRERFEAHLAACPHCTAYLDQIRFTIATTGTFGADDLSPEALSELTNVFRAWAADRP